MKRNLLLSFILILTLTSCGNSEDSGGFKNDYDPSLWRCVEDGDSLYSIHISTNDFGGAQKGCSCSEIREFEYRKFGEIDESALKSDFGC